MPQAKAFGLSNVLLAVRPVLGSDHDVMNVRVRREPPVFGAQTIVSAQEVLDHIWRGADAVDTYRVLLSSALDAYLSETSNRLHHVMRTLTTSSATLMSMRLIAGNYGMAYGHMPELHWYQAYPWALSLMRAVGLALYHVFRRIH